jgi:hypothetical protein
MKKFPKESRSSFLNRSINKFNLRLSRPITDKFLNNGMIKSPHYGSKKFKRLTISWNS